MIRAFHNFVSFSGETELTKTFGEIRASERICYEATFFLRMGIEYNPSISVNRKWRKEK